MAVGRNGSVGVRIAVACVLMLGCMSCGQDEASSSAITYRLIPDETVLTMPFSGRVEGSRFSSGNRLIDPIKTPPGPLYGTFEVVPKERGPGEAFAFEILRMDLWTPGGATGVIEITGTEGMILGYTDRQPPLAGHATVTYRGSEVALEIGDTTGGLDAFFSVDRPPVFTGLLFHGVLDQVNSITLLIYAEPVH